MKHQNSTWFFLTLKPGLRELILVSHFLNHRTSQTKQGSGGKNPTFEHGSPLAGPSSASSMDS